MTAGQVTHAELVKRAAVWLRRIQRCSVVVTEITSSGSEQPDALGWRFGASVLVECKATRADFLSDAKKPFRIFPETGMGNYRFYMVPSGLVSLGEVPNGWGLVEVEGRACRVSKRSHPLDCRCAEMWPLMPLERTSTNCLPPFPGHRAYETDVLLSVIRRTQQGGTGGRAHIYIVPFDDEESEGASA